MARLHPIAGAAALVATLSAFAQDTSLRPVTITPAAVPPAADVTGFGDVPLREVPLSATVVPRQTIEDYGARRLADLTPFDPSVSDAYNAPGYWDFLAIRGFTLDNRFNYRREGLPISAETMIPLDNKERVEILRGTSGIQAGTSAPGGLVNYVVKRPTGQPLRQLRTEVSERGSVLGAADISQRFGAGDALGLRLNLAQERLRPQVRSTQGDRSLVALAGDWRVSRDSVLEAEMEWSRREQASQVGFSLLGSVLPAVPDPRLNLNNQPWLPPSEFEGLTGTLRWQQALGGTWSWSAQVGSQRLRTDDRTAFPFGCTAEGNFDRYCSDGTFDMYDFRSENERRRQDAASVNLRGRLQWGGVAHDVSFGVLHSNVRQRFGRQAFNFIGVANVDGSVVLAPNPALTAENTNRDERSLELSAHDAIHWTPQLSTWVGLRHTRMHRQSIRTDDTQPTDYRQSLTTPWVALTYKVASGSMVYGSWGQGAESTVAPNLPTFTNAGQPLPVLKSRQVELGLKGGDGDTTWNAALFRIQRPAFTDDCAAGPCTRRLDGDAVHTGLELEATHRIGALSAGAGALLLDAKRRGSTATPVVNGRRPVNVPDWTFKLRADYRVAALPGLTVGGRLVHEGKRSVLPDESAMLPSWTRVDALLAYDMQVRGTALRWTFGVDNLLNRRYWRESPFQFGHVYLYPGAPRTFRVGLTAEL